jgi:hypothetical protein
MDTSTFKSRPNFYITPENFKLIEGPGFWYRNDVPIDNWSQVGRHFANSDTVALFASGSVVAPVQSYGVQAVGGIDWLKLEPNPIGTEPPQNAYHFVIGLPDNNGYPVFGPYREGCLVPHWFNYKDLDKYT